MLLADIMQEVVDARVDAKSFSDFIWKPAEFMVIRRLAPNIHTLQYYVNRFEVIANDFTQALNTANAAAIAATNNAVGLIDNVTNNAYEQVNSAIEGVAIDANLVTDALVTTSIRKEGQVVRTQAAKNSDFINVKDFGAVGDGVADDYAAIMAAINSTKFEGMGSALRPSAATVYFPLGKYYVGQTINLKRAVRLKGESSGSSETFATVLEFAQNIDGIIINSMDSNGAVGSAPRSTTAGGSVIDGLTILQRGFAKRHQIILDYNPNDKQFISYGGNAISVGTAVHSQDDRLVPFFTGTIATHRDIPTIPVVPNKYVVGLSIGDTVTGATSGATAKIAHIGHKVLVYVLSDVVGTFQANETVTSELGSFVIRSTFSGRKYKLSTLSATSGSLAVGDILADASMYGTGVIFRTRAEVKNCNVLSFPNFGISITTDGTAGGNANCSILSNIHITNIGKHGLLTLGGDSNAGNFTALNVTGCTGYGIKDASFLGNHYFGCHASENTLGHYFSAIYNNYSVFLGVYSEGGAQTQPFIYPTSRFGRNTTVIGGDHGAGIFPAYENVRPTYLNGDKFNLLNAMYATNTTTSGKLTEGGVSFRASQAVQDTISLVAASQLKVGEGSGIGFYLGAGGDRFDANNTDSVRGGNVRVAWDTASRARLEVNLLKSNATSSSFLQITSSPSGNSVSAFPVVEGGQIVRLIFGSYGSGYTESPVLTGRGVYTGFEATTTISDGKVVDYEIINPLSGLDDTALQRALTIVNNEVLPGTDNSMTLGSTINRWKEVHAFKANISGGIGVFGATPLSVKPEVSGLKTPTTIAEQKVVTDSLIAALASYGLITDSRT